MKIKEISVFKTMRHMEAVRNYLNTIIKEILLRGEQHDQTKLQPPEIELFDKYTKELQGITYGSVEYKKCMKKLKPAIEHHYANNRHHPEHHVNGIKDMTLIDLIELICDWKAASMRHNDGNLLKSIEINQKKLKYSNEVNQILINTAIWLEAQQTIHYAKES